MVPGKVSKVSWKGIGPGQNLREAREAERRAGWGPVALVWPLGPLSCGASRTGGGNPRQTARVQQDAPHPSSQSSPARALLRPLPSPHPRALLGEVSSAVGNPRATWFWALPRIICCARAAQAAGWHTDRPAGRPAGTRECKFHICIVDIPGPKG